MRTALLFAALALAIASCSGDDDAAPASPTIASTTTTSVAPSTEATTPTTTTASPETTTTTEAVETTTTTLTTIAPGPGALALTRVVFEPVAYVTVKNVGNGPLELSTHWLCQRPAYVQLPQMTIEPGDTVAIGLGEDAPPELVEYVAVFELGTVLGDLARDDGEMALYTAPFFDDPFSIADYVEWGLPGHGRSNVAVLAGIWEDGAFIEVPIEATSLSSSGTIGAGPEDWFTDIGG